MNTVNRNGDWVCFKCARDEYAHGCDPRPLGFYRDPPSPDAVCGECGAQPPEIVRLRLAMLAAVHRDVRVPDVERDPPLTTRTLANAMLELAAGTPRAPDRGGDANPTPPAPATPPTRPSASVRASEPASCWRTPPAAAAATGVGVKTIRGWIKNRRVEVRVRNREANPLQKKYLVNVDEVAAAARLPHAAPDRGGATPEIAEQVDRMMKGRR